LTDCLCSNFVVVLIISSVQTRRLCCRFGWNPVKNKLIVLVMKHSYFLLKFVLYGYTILSCTDTVTNLNFQSIVASELKYKLCLIEYLHMHMLHDITYTISNVWTQLLLHSHSILMDANWTQINHPIFPYNDNKIGNHFSLQVRILPKSYITAYLQEIPSKRIWKGELLQSDAINIPCTSSFYVKTCVDLLVPLSSHFVSNNQYGHRDIPLLSQLVFAYVLVSCCIISFVDTNTNNFVSSQICQRTVKQ